MERPRTTQPSAPAMLPTPQSSRSGIYPNTALPASTPFIVDGSRPGTPAQSFTASSINEPQDDDKIASSRVESPRYRDELRKHGVYIDGWDLRGIPDTIKIAAKAVIGCPRTSPEPGADDLSKMRAKLARVAEGDEGITGKAITATELFQIPSQHLNEIVNGSSVPFNKRGLPHTPGRGFPPISGPKPDLQYAYSQENFTLDELAVMSNHRLNAYAYPSTAGYWPFFLVEMKAASRQGTHFIGENQNAGSGAHCVNSVETLLEYISKERPKERAVNSMVFSCVADGQHGTIWVHWQECRTGGRPTYVSTELCDYTWKHNPEDMLNFRRAVRNIIDHGVDTRLPMLKKALTSLIEIFPTWRAADKLARSRSFGDGDEEGGSQSSRKRANRSRTQ